MTRREKRKEVRLTFEKQHGIPRVSATAVDRSEQAKEKERKQIEQYKALERNVSDRVCGKLSAGVLSSEHQY